MEQYLWFFHENLPQCAKTDLRYQHFSLHLFLCKKKCKQIGIMTSITSKGPSSLGLLSATTKHFLKLNSKPCFKNTFCGFKRQIISYQNWLLDKTPCSIRTHRVCTISIHDHPTVVFVKPNKSMVS